MTRRYERRPGARNGEITHLLPRGFTQEREPRLAAEATGRRDTTVRSRLSGNRPGLPGECLTGPAGSPVRSRVWPRRGLARKFRAPRKKRRPMGYWDFPVSQNFRGLPGAGYTTVRAGTAGRSGNTGQARSDYSLANQVRKLCTRSFGIKSFDFQNGLCCAVTSRVRGAGRRRCRNGGRSRG